MKSSDEIADSEPAATCFYLAPEIRRAILWALGGLVLITIVSQVLMVLQNRFTVQGLIAACSISVVAAIVLISLFGPRIRVDHDGISRRTLGRWDLWPWQAFAEGRIRLGRRPGEYEFPERPFYSRDLSLGLLETTDKQLVEGLIRKVWRPAEPGAPPDSMRVHLSGLGQRVLELTSTGVRLCSNGGTANYRWDQCVTIEICRTQHDCEGFLNITLLFDDDRVICRPWEADGSLVQFLCEYANPESIRLWARTGPARSIIEVDLRTRWINTELTQRRVILRWMPLGYVGIAFVLVVALGWIGLMMAAIYGPLLYALRWLLKDIVETFEQMQRDLDLDRTRLLNENSGSASEFAVSGTDWRYSPPLNPRHGG